MESDSHIGNYIIVQRIGAGAFSNVYLARHESTDLLVAIKVLKVESIKENNSQTHLLREINTMMKIEHPFITKLFEVIETPQKIYLVMEYSSEGTLMQQINQLGPMAAPGVKRIAIQLVSILDFLHNHIRFAHRDIKAENILLDKNKNIKLTDFGLCHHFNNDAESFRTLCGSIPYIAPEIIKKKPYTVAVDIWSAGVLLYGLAVGRFPFEEISMQSLIKKIVYDDPVFPDFLPNMFTDLLRRMLDKDPKSRINAKQLKTHPYFTDVDFAQISATPIGSTKENFERIMKSKGITEQGIMNLPEHDVIAKILFRDAENAQMKRNIDLESLKKDSTSTRNRPKPSLNFDKKQPDPILQLAKRLARPKVVKQRAQIAQSDTLETMPLHPTQYNNEMSV